MLDFAVCAVSLWYFVLGSLDNNLSPFQAQNIIKSIGTGDLQPHRIARFHRKGGIQGHLHREEGFAEQAAYLPWATVEDYSIDRTADLLFKITQEPVAMALLNHAVGPGQLEVNGGGELAAFAVAEKYAATADEIVKLMLHGKVEEAAYG